MSVFDSIKLDHLDRMTDSTGLIQHAIYGVPRRESGYTTDDNARALLLCARLHQDQPSERMLARVTVYLSFLEHARCPVRGFHNFMGYQRDWLDATGTSDCQGQAVRGLAEVLGSNLPDGYRALARELILSVLPAIAELRSLRAQAYIIMAWSRLRTAGVNDIEALEGVAWQAAERLVECYRRSQRPGWNWFESQLTYANAVLPHALFLAANRWGQSEFLEVAADAFDFLDCETTAKDMFWPVGNHDWYPHGEAKALYDQQPVEAVTMADAAQTAYRLLDDDRYLGTFDRAHGWFLGRNSLGESLVDSTLGGCCDGLQPTGLNRNQGAESTLAWLWTQVQQSELQLARRRDQRSATSADSVLEFRGSIVLGDQQFEPMP